MLRYVRVGPRHFYPRVAPGRTSLATVLSRMCSLAAIPTASVRPARRPPVGLSGPQRQMNSILAHATASPARPRHRSALVMRRC